MKLTDTLRLRDELANRVAGMVESSDFCPEKDRHQRRLFHALCAAHRVASDELTIFNSRNVGATKVAHLTQILTWMKHGHNEDPHASKHFAQAQKMLEQFLNAFPCD
jgi:FMN-dependent NADH-azoreductase